MSDVQFPDLSEKVERELALMLGSITHHIQQFPAEPENGRVKFSEKAFSGG